MPKLESYGPRTTLLSSLCLPIRAELAFRRYGYHTVEDLMGSDPFFDVTPIGPDDNWIEEVEPEHPRYPGQKHYFRRELEHPNMQQGFRWPRYAWRDVKGIGITYAIQTMEAIALWQQENAKEKLYGDTDRG
jgi:hypothetical protein